MGHAKCTFACLISSTTNQRPNDLYNVVSSYQQHFCQENRHRQLNLRAIMIYQEVDLVASDFNGTAWPYRGIDNLSTTDEVSIFLTPPGPSPLWRPGSILDIWADVCGLLKPPASQRSWNVNEHGAFSIPRKTLGLRQTDQSCHHQT